MKKQTTSTLAEATATAAAAGAGWWVAKPVSE